MLRQLVLLLMMMLLALCAAGGEEGEKPEKTGFEAAAEWARFAHGFPEEDLVLDDMDVDADGLREGGGHAHETVVEVQAGNGEGLLQMAWKLVAEGFFGAADSSTGRAGRAGEPYARIVTGSQQDDSSEVSTSDYSGGSPGMEIMDDDDEPPRASGTNNDAVPSDEFHQVDAAAWHAASVPPCVARMPSPNAPRVPENVKSQ